MGCVLTKHKTFAEPIDRVLVDILEDSTISILSVESKTPSRKLTKSIVFG